MFVCRSCLIWSPIIVVDEGIKFFLTSSTDLKAQHERVSGEEGRRKGLLLYDPQVSAITFV